MSFLSRVLSRFFRKPAAVSPYCFDDPPFTLGVASGDPLPDGVVLWTRLAPDPLSDSPVGGMPAEPFLVEWEVTKDQGFTEIAASGSETARPEDAHSLHIEVQGLEPGSRYFYRFKTGKEVSPVGRTKTAPSGSVAEVKFAFASCQYYEHGYFTAYKHMAKEDLDVICHLGDYIYEYGRDEKPSPDGNVRHHDSPEIKTLAAYRHRHALYRLDKDLQAAHASAPWIMTWDDHEVDNNYADEISETGTNLKSRRALAYQAYYEHMPLRRASLPDGPDMRLYRRIAYGDLLQFDVLDTRQYRDNQAAGDGIRPPNSEQSDPKRTLTGADQEKWLIEGLASTETRWKIVAQQVFFAQLDFARTSGKWFSMDSWDGYLGSRNRIVKAVADSLAGNFVVLTGDVHASWASELKADFNDQKSKTTGVELVATSISSGGNGSDKKSDTDKILARNPHIKFFNNYRGYVVCTVTPASLRADFRIVTKVSKADFPIHTRVSFRVDDGVPGLTKIADNPPPSGSRLTSDESDLTGIETLG